MPTQEEINNGQKKFNCSLCKSIWAVLQAFRQFPGATPGSELEKAILAAEALTVEVAKITPPGCDPSKLG